MTCHSCEARTYAMNHKDYTKFYELFRENHQAVNKLEGKQVQLTRSISNLTQSRDIIVNQMFKNEDVEKKTDKRLEELTGNDSESWFWTFSNSVDDINELIVSKCVLVSNLKVDIDVLKEQHNQIDKEQEAVRERLMDEFDKKNKEKVTA